MAYRDWMLPEDDQELRKQAGIEASALSRIRPEGRFRFVENVGTYRSATRARHGSLGRIGPLRAEKMRGIHPRLREEWDDFINTYSEVVVKYGGELPMDWLVKQTPQDLTFLNILTGADVQWLIDAKRAALEDRQERQIREQKIQRVVDKLTSFEQMAADLAMAKYEGRWEDVKQILEGKDRAEQDRLHDASMAINVLAGRADETVEERRKRIEAWVRSYWDPTQPEPTYWQYHFHPEGPSGFIGGGLQMAGTAMEGIVDFFNSTAAIAAGVEDLIDEGTWNGSARAARIQKAQDLAQETYEQWVEEGIISKGWGESLLEANPDNLVARVKAEEIAPDVLWEVYKTEEPEEAQDFLMGFALGDEDLAKHAFFRLLKDSDPEVIDTAIEELDKELSAQEWQLIEQLREPDTAENVRAAIASYGEWVEDNATYLSAIFGEAFKQIESNAYFDLDAILERAREKANVAESPSEYFGLQGTLVGLGIDLALINGLDPISWLGGARLSIAKARTFTASQVRRFVKSPRGIAQLQDAVVVARSGLRGEIATVALLDELDAVGLGDEFYAAAQGRSPVLPKGTWSRGPRGRAATEVVLDKLVDDLQLTLPKADPKMVDSLKAKGIDRPATVYIDPTKGVAWLDPEDLPLLAAIKESGEGSVPIVLRRAEMPKMIPGQGSPEFEAKLSTQRRLSQRIEELQQQQQREGRLTYEEEFEITQDMRARGATADQIEEEIDFIRMEREARFREIQERIDELEDQHRLVQSELDLIIERDRAKQPKFLSLDEIGWRNPEWWNDDGFASVRNNLPESTVLGDVDWDRLNNIYERALLLGAGFSSPLAAMVSMAFPREIKHAFQQVSQGKASLRDVMRFARREYALTRYTWTGRTWARQVRHTIMRLFGDNEWLAEGFLREFRDILRTRSNASLRREEVLGELAELTRRKKAYESKYLNLRHRNFGAVAEEMGMLDDLRRYADEGFPGEFVPPHEADIARSFVLRSPKAHSMGRVRDFDLRTQPTVDGRGREFLLIDENGEVAAGLRYFEQGGGSIWVRPDLRRTGLLEEIIDQLKGTSEKMVVRMLHAWTRDPSTTARGGAALQRLIKRELDDMPPSAADDLGPVQAQADEAVAATGDEAMGTIPPSAADDPDLVRAQVDEAVAAAEDEALTYEAIVAQINKLYDELSELEKVSFTNKELNAFMQRMWETFNREYIAKTGYYKVDPETGLVDWNDLRPGSAEGTFTYNQDGELIYIPPSRQMGDLAGVTLSTGLSPEAHAQKFFYTLNEPLSWNAPLSVLDMHAARTLSRKQFLAWRNVTWLEFLRQMTHGALRLWKIDKVFRPATAIVATWDEWTRIFHDFGRPAYFLWMEDKLRQVQEYLIALGTPHKREGHRWLDTDRVHHKYIKRWERRKQELASAWPQQMRAMHRHFDERFGEGYGEILPGQPGHLEAAEQFTSLMLGDEGFRKALISKEAFDEWWESPNAEWIKKGSTIMPDGTVVPNSLMRDEIYQGHLQFFDRVALYGARKRGTVEATMRAWAKAVAEIEASGGKAASVSLPRWVLKDFGPVTGVRRNAPGQNVISALHGKLMDQLFLEPSIYRQQFLADIVRRYEEARLTSLYKSQGRQIVPDTEIEALTNGAFRVNRHTEEWGLIEELAERFGIIPESWVRRLAENKAVEEAEHIMYAWHKTSRLGRSLAGEAAVPFGGPWADMWGYYGRSMLMPMTLRGVFSKGVLDIARFAEPVLNWLPGLKTAALLSKMAATSFDIDRGFAGEGAFSIDISPLFFLPTEDEHPMMTLLPPLGAVPMILIDTVLRAIHDPVEEPEEFQRMVDGLAEWIPSVGFQQEQMGRVFGGGITAAVLKVGSDLSAFFGKGYLTPLHDLVGDITSEQMATRNIRALLADPEIWNDLINSSSGEEYEVNYQWVVNKAWQRAGGAHAVESLSRQFVPARVDLDPSADELLDVWLDAAEKFEELKVPSLKSLDLNDPKSVQAVVDDIRERFWDLPQDERDLLVIQYPALVVNMVGGWAWTKSAEDRHPEMAGVPYRSQGGAEGLARHFSYIKEGLIRPISPGLLTHLILGTYFEARQRQAKRVYSLVVEERNNWIWENAVTEDWKAWFDNAAKQPGVRELLPEPTGRALWEMWTSMERVVEEEYMKAFGVDPETASEEERAQFNISLPGEMESWSKVWRGMNDENFSQRFRDIQIPYIPEEAARVMDILGIPVPPEGITGEQFLNVIHQAISRDVVEHPAVVRSSAEYGIFLNTRGQQVASAEEVLQTAVINRVFSDEFRQAVDELLIIRDQNNEIRAVEGRIPPDRIHMLREKWNEVRIRGDASDFDFDEIWKDMFERDYGPQDWEPPTPPADTSNALPVEQIRYVLDGDTLVIQLADSERYQRVRLLGIDAAEANTAKGRQQQQQLKQAIMNTNRRGGKVQIVPDTTATGGRYTDAYGRILAWLFLDGVPYYFPEEISP